MLGQDIQNQYSNLSYQQIKLYVQQSNKLILINIYFMQPNTNQDDYDDSKMMQMVLQFKQLHIQIQMLIGTFVMMSSFFKPNLASLQNLRNSLLRFFSPKYYYEIPEEQEQFLASIYIYLGMMSQLLYNGKAEKEYKLAISYEQKNPQANLSLALFLYNQRKYGEALRYIKKLSVSNTFKGKHQLNIFTILVDKVKENFYWSLWKIEKAKNSIAKVQFIKKIIKFKQLFLYHCVEVQFLCQKSFCSLAYLLLHTNRFADGLTLTYKLKNINQPPTEQIQYHLAYLFHKFAKFQESIECAKQGLRINPQNQEIYRYLMLSFFVSHQISQAVNSAMRLITIKKTSSLGYQMLGLALTLLKRKQLGLECSRLSVIIQPSERTYMSLAHQLSQSSRFEQAQICLFKSLKIKPSELNYFELGRLYFQNSHHLNAILCFFEAITYNYLKFQPYLYLGICAKQNRFFRQIINIFISKLQSAFSQDQFLQTYLGAYKFVSNQSHIQFYAFLRNFLEEKQKGGEAPYSDIADKLIQYMPTPSSLFQNILFILIIGALSRAKNHHIKSYEIYYPMIYKYGMTNKMDFIASFTSLYQRQISKIPKDLQPFLLQFIIAEMAKQHPNQALKCFHKLLSYAQGQYQQFYVQLYKRIEKDIQNLQLINMIANCTIYRQSLDQSDSEIAKDIINDNSFADFEKYIQYLGAMTQIVYKLSKLSQIKEEWDVKSLFATVIENARTLNLLLNVQHLQRAYYQLFDQIKNQQNTFIENILKLIILYSRQVDSSHQRNRIKQVIETYFDCFVLNQKVKLIFNHFHPYIITKSCHKQFAVILHKIKDCPYYRSSDLREDLQNMFREGNKHTNKEFKVEYVKIGKTYSTFYEVSSIINQNDLLMELNSSTKSQLDVNRRQQQQFMESFSSYQQETNEVEQKYLGSKIKNIYNKEQKVEVESNDSQKPTQLKYTKKIKIINLPKNCNNLLGSQSLLSQESQQSQDQLYAHHKGINSVQWEQIRWYEFELKPIRRFHLKLYEKFNELLYQNAYQLIKYLSHHSNLKYVAQHMIQSTQFLPNHSYKVMVQLGDQDDIKNQARGGLQERTLNWIQTLSPMHILRWIKDIAQGISQLQNLGIYHADLFFRNTIKVTREEAFCFKIIDFDKAFKVSKKDKKDKVYEATKNLLDFWLRFRFDNRNSRAKIYSFDFQSGQSQKNSSSTIYNEEEIIRYIFMGADDSLIKKLLTIKRQSIFSSKRIAKCFELLREHMRLSHLNQYSSLILKLLTQNEQTTPVDVQTINEILIYILNLINGEIGYIQFAQKVKMIEKRKYSDS